VGPNERDLRLTLLPCPGVRELEEDVVGDRLGPVLVGVDVERGAEPLVRDRAVVALEVVLAGDLPVRP